MNLKVKKSKRFPLLCFIVVSIITKLHVSQCIISQYQASDIDIFITLFLSMKNLV